MVDILVPRRREDFFNPDGTFTLRALRFFEGLTDQSNNSVDEIEIIKAKEFEIISVDADFSAGRFQIIICKNVTDISIALNESAIKDDEVHIKRRLGLVNVIGLIDGLTNKTININNYSMHLVFDGTDWSEI